MNYKTIHTQTANLEQTIADMDADGYELVAMLPCQLLVMAT
jgi:hypothetical protein